jgi:prolyl oligopeptidase
MIRRPFLPVLALSMLPLVHCTGGGDTIPQGKAPVATVSSTTTTAVPKPSDELASGAPVKTPKKPVVNTYHGVSVTDDYQWLESWKDAEVKTWSDAQNVYTHKLLDAVPERSALAARVKELLSSSSADWFGLTWKGKQLFALEARPPKQQAFLVVLASPDDQKSERVVLDPNVLDPTGGTTIDWYVPSHDGKMVAVSLSKGGSESGTVHVYDVADGKEHATDVIPRAHGGTAGGDLAWMKDGSGFWYTRYPHEGERPPVDLDFYQQVYFHKLGSDPKSDTYAIGKDFPRIAEITLETSEDGKWVLASVANGDGGEFAHYLARAASPAASKAAPPVTKEAVKPNEWKNFATYDDKVRVARFGRDGDLYLLSLRGAPKGKITRVTPASLMTPGLSTAKVVVPEGDTVIQQLTTTKTHLYVVSLAGGPSQVKVYDLVAAAKAKEPIAGKEVPILPVSSVSQVTALEGEDVLVRNQSFLEPPAWYRYVGKTQKSTKTALFQTAAADFADAEVVRETCTSKDGTKVPINVLRKKGTPLDGNNLTMLYGYGGYGVSLSPRFDVMHRLWLDQGGVFALTNLRGGGEFGEEWHLAGNLTKKQHVFDDFLACGQWLLDQKYTRPDKLAIRGGSNGGLLMGAALTQKPEMFGAVVSHVGIYDMLRVELTPNGAFNVTEFGTVKDKAQFDALYAYSPYHRVKDGAAYPAVLMLTGENDPRVDPYNSRKMAARLQAASSSKKPILLRTSGDTGHGIGSPLSAQIDEETDVYGFLFQQLGHTFAPKK